MPEELTREEVELPSEKITVEEKLAHLESAFKSKKRHSFKKLILDNKLIKNEKDEKMFINLTYSYSDGYHEETYQKKIKFHNNHIDLECVVNEILS